MGYPTDNPIVTSHDSVPNFAGVSPDRVSTQSGFWDETSTWGGAAVPTDTQKVIIDSAHTVTIRNTSAVAKAVGVAGTLAFSTTVNTKLVVQHLLIYGPPTSYTGTMTQGNPRTSTAVDSGVTCEIVIRNIALESTTYDPSRYGNSVLCWGNWFALGQSKTPWLRVSVEPAAGHTSYTLASAATNWAVGDEVVIPDSRELNHLGGETWTGYQARWEHRTISSMASGNTVVNLSSALTYNHPGGESDYGVGDETGEDDFLPHVGNLTRNVIVRSEDGTGVRGHTMMFNRADVDLRYIRFKELGRTTNGELSSYFTTSGGFFEVKNETPIVVSLFNSTLVGARQFVTGDTITIAGVGGNTAANGTWTVTEIEADLKFSLDGSSGNGTYTAGTGTSEHFGSGNQIGRYAFHVHHHWGPVSTPANGYQLTLIGFVIDDPLPAPPSNTLPASKWALTVHDSHYGLYQDGICHHYAGSNIQTEDGNESYNVFDGILSMNNIGDVNPRDIDGRSGAGAFFAGFNNYFRNCVMASNPGKNVGIVSGSGFEYADAAPASNKRIPLYKGADMSGGTEDVEYDTISSKLIPILQCENIECYGCHAGGFVLWNLGTDGYVEQAIGNSLMKNIKLWNQWEFVIFDYPTVNFTMDGLISRNSKTLTYCAGFIWGDYRAGSPTVLKNMDIRGCQNGINECRDIRGSFTIQDSYFRCKSNGIVITTPATPGTGAGSGNQAIVINNCKCEQMGSGTYHDLYMNYYLGSGNTNLRVTQSVHVYNHQQVSGDNFRLYYNEQASTYVMPQTGGNISVGCPEAGLTNAQAYVAYNQDGTSKGGSGSLSDPTGCCIAGAIAPAGATTRSGVYGLVETLSAPSQGIMLVGSEAFTLGG